MKKNVSLLIFLAIGTVVFMASYRSQDVRHETPLNLLTGHSWKFERAESLSSQSAYVVNMIYANAQLNFTDVFTYQGEFFERPIQGTWHLDGDQLVLDRGTSAEEKMEIAELTEDMLKVRIMEKGASVTLVYR